MALNLVAWFGFAVGSPIFAGEQAGLYTMSIKSTLCKSIERRSMVQIDSDTSILSTTTLLIGNPPSEQVFILDTGSSDFWVNTNSSQGQYYDYQKSRTFVGSVKPSDFNIEYTDGNNVEGFWGLDLITVSGKRFMSRLGFATKASVNQVLGLGLVSGESTADSQLDSTRQTVIYPNFPQLLKQNGIVQRNAYSFWLGIDRLGEGNILFGGLDYSKFHGKLGLMPMVDEYSINLHRAPHSLSVMLHEVSIAVGGSLLYPFNINSPALLDSGSTLTYLPPAVLSSLLNQIPFQFSRELNTYLTRCDTIGQINFNLSGIILPINLRSLLLPTRGPSDPPDWCVLGVAAKDNDHLVLGETFLRSVYVVFDLENYEIGIAIAASSAINQPGQVQKIITGIPGAIKAPYYSHTNIISK